METAKLGLMTTLYNGLLLIQGTFENIQHVQNKLQNIFFLKYLMKNLYSVLILDSSDDWQRNATRPNLLAF